MKFSTCFLLAVFGLNLSAQEIKPARGFTNDIGNVVAMLDDLKSRVTRSVENLSLTETDFLLDEESNRIGALILHLAATEKYYQLYTFKGRGFNKTDDPMWEKALNLGATARQEFTGQPISYYLNIWAEVRNETKRLLKTKNDKWFAQKVNKTSMNNHWAWYHVMEHQANHMGQIRFFIKRL